MFAGKLSLTALKGGVLLWVPVFAGLAGVGTWAVIRVASSSPTAITAAAPNSTGTATSSGSASSGNNGNGNGNGNVKEDKVTFTLTGAVVPEPGLKLGTPTTLPVTVTNPSSNKNKEVLTVTSITVTATAAAAGCDTTNLSIGSYNATAPGATPYVLTVGQSKVIPIPITLIDKPNDDQTPCRGKTFPLHVEGTAGVTK